MKERASADDFGAQFAVVAELSLNGTGTDSKFGAAERPEGPIEGAHQLAEFARLGALSLGGRLLQSSGSGARLQRWA